MYVHNKLNSLSVGVLKREGERSGGDVYMYKRELYFRRLGLHINCGIGPNL